MNYNPNNIKEYNEEIKKIKEDYDNFHDKLNNNQRYESESQKFPELLKKKNQALKGVSNARELRLLQTPDTPDTTEESRNNYNKTFKKENDEVIEL